jgi:hypothetical protein
MYVPCILSSLLLVPTNAQYIYSRAPLSVDSLSAVSVIRDLPQPEKNWKIKKINGLQVSKRAPSENGP